MKNARPASFPTAIRLFLICLAICLFNVAAFGQEPIPVIYQPLSPAGVNPGHAAFTLRIHGTGFQIGANVSWNGLPLRTRFLSHSLLSVQIPAYAVANAGTASIKVQNSTSNFSNEISFFIRKSSPTVTVASDPNTVEAGEVVVGDFNNDHRADISVATQNQSGGMTADSYLSLGNGRFNRVAGTGSLFLGLMLPGDFAADFNNDGHLDMALCNSSGGPDQVCAIALGDGHGGLAATSYAVGYSGTGVAADIDQDGILDALTTYWDGSVTQLYFQPGHGDGTFGFVGPNAITLNFFAGGLPVVGDFNGDGKLDAAVPGGDSDYVATLLGNGDGTFQTEVDNSISCSGWSSVVADLNRDGKLDILTACINGTVAILLGNGNGTFAPPISIALPYQTNGTLAIMDLNGDGKLDLATLTATNSGDQTLNIALGNGDGTFQPSTSQPAGLNTFPNDLFAVGDFNNDGLPDFALSGSLIGNASPGTVLLQTRPR